jgi:hypothetical protein
VDHGAQIKLCSHCGTCLRYEVIVEGGRYGRRGIGLVCAEKVGATASQLQYIRQSISNLKTARQRKLEQDAALAANNEYFADFGGVAGVEELIHSAHELAQVRIAAETEGASDEDRAEYTATALRAYLPFPEFALDVLDSASRYGLSERQLDVIFDALEKLDGFTLDTVPAPRLPIWLGEVGAKITVDGIIRRFVAGEAYTYGAATPFLVVVETAAGDTVTTWTTAQWLDRVEVGDDVKISGTVKSLNTYDHVKQTMLTRVKLLLAVRDGEVVEN